MSMQDVTQKYSASWSAEAWSQGYARALAYVFELPHARSMDSAELQDMVRDLSQTSVFADCLKAPACERLVVEGVHALYQGPGLTMKLEALLLRARPGTCQNPLEVDKINHSGQYFRPLHCHRGSMSAAVACIIVWCRDYGVSLGLCVQLGWSVEGLERIQRHAEEFLPRLFPLQADCYDAAAASTLQPVSLMRLTVVTCRLCWLQRSAVVCVVAEVGGTRHALKESLTWLEQAVDTFTA